MKSRERVTLKAWQWGEVLLVAVLALTVSVVQVSTSSTTASALICTAQLVLLIHVATWFVPLIRARRDAP